MKEPVSNDEGLDALLRELPAESPDPAFRARVLAAAAATPQLPRGRSNDEGSAWPFWTAAALGAAVGAAFAIAIGLQSFQAPLATDATIVASADPSLPLLMAPIAED